MKGKRKEVKPEWREREGESEKGRREERERGRHLCQKRERDQSKLVDVTIEQQGEQS